MTAHMTAQARPHSARAASLHPSVTRVIGALTCALAVLGLITGCASSGVQRSPADSHHGTSAQAPAPKEDAAAADGGGAGDVAERAIRVTSDVRVRVEDIDGADQALTERVQQAKGHFDRRAMTSGSNQQTAEYTVRIPADGHDSFVGGLDEVGTVTSATTNAEDVTLEKVDLESRIASLESSIKSLRGMLENAQTTSEMLEVERELANREADLASLQSQLDVLSDEVSYSTVNITMSTEYIAAPTTRETGFFAGIKQGWEDMVASSSRFIEWLGYALPGLMLLTLIGAGLWFAGLGNLLRRLLKSLKGPHTRIGFPQAGNPARSSQQQPQGTMPPVDARAMPPKAPANAPDVVPSTAPGTAGAVTTGTVAPGQAPTDADTDVSNRGVSNTGASNTGATDGVVSNN